VLTGRCGERRGWGPVSPDGAPLVDSTLGGWAAVVPEDIINQADSVWCPGRRLGS